MSDSNTPEQNSTHRPPFTLRTDIELDQVISSLWGLSNQSATIQSSLFELTCTETHIESHFEQINDLVSQLDTNISQIKDLSGWLASRSIQEVI